MIIDHWRLGVITCFQTQPWWWYRMHMWWENAWSVKTPPNPTNCCVGFPSSKWSFRVLHLKFLVYTSLDLCSLWMFHIYCTRFTICLVFLWNVQSVFVRHAVAISATCFLWKSVFFDDWLRGFFCFSAAGFWAAWHAPQQYLGCCARVPIGSLGNLDIAWW
jgi:hypothetical protein